MERKPPIDSTQWDDVHNDPTLDIVIRSADGISFRASSYRLRKISPALIDEVASLVENVIQMDFLGSAIRRLLDFALDPARNVEQFKGTVTECYEFSQLVGRYRCEALRIRATEDLGKAVAAAPLDYLVLASKLDHICMAVAALQAGARSNKPLEPADLLNAIAAIRNPWRMPILHITLRPKPGSASLRAGWPSSREIAILLAVLCGVETVPRPLYWRIEGAKKTRATTRWVKPDSSMPQ